MSFRGMSFLSTFPRDQCPVRSVLFYCYLHFTCDSFTTKILRKCDH